MKKIGTQSIETKRLLLRPFLESDAQAMYDSWASRPDNLLHVTWDAHESPEVTQQSIARWVENYQNMDFYKWAICLKENPEHVLGDISVVDMDEAVNVCEVGYILSKDYWGQGLMPEAAMKMMEYGFYEMGLDMIWCGHFEGNEKSRRVIEKCGMIPMFRRMEAFPLIGKKHVVCYYSLTAEEFAARPKIAFRAFTIESKR